MIGLFDTDAHFHRLMNKAGGTFLELSNGGAANGMKKTADDDDSLLVTYCISSL